MHPYLVGRQENVTPLSIILCMFRDRVVEECGIAVVFPNSRRAKARFPTTDIEVIIGIEFIEGREKFLLRKPNV